VSHNKCQQNQQNATKTDKNDIKTNKMPPKPSKMTSKPTKCHQISKNDNKTTPTLTNKSLHNHHKYLKNYTKSTKITSKLHQNQQKNTKIDKNHSKTTEMLTK